MILTPQIGSLLPGIFSPPAVTSVVLAATSQFTLQSHELNSRPDSRNLGLVSILYGLRSGGFEPVSIYNPAPKEISDIQWKQADIVDRFRGMGAAQKNAVIGISTTTDEYYKYPPLARLLRDAFPDAKIIAGGVHFYRDKIPGEMDAVEAVLYTGLADAVQVGHAQSFIDFIIKHRGVLERADGPGLYRLDPHSGKLLGKGVGRYPSLERIPYYFGSKMGRISFILRDGCRNRCDFCTAALGIVPAFSHRVMIEGVRRLFTRHHPVTLSLRDSNPFDERDYDYYAAAFRTMDAISPTDKSVYINPGLLVSDDYRAELVALFKRHNVRMFYAGRDAVDERSAAAIGSRYRGRVKGQAQLDAERDALIAFLDAMKRPRPKDELKLTLSYIITPQDDSESAGAIIKDMRAFGPLVGDDLNISAGLFPHMPYPGTRARARFADAIEPGEFEFHKLAGGTISPWKPGAGPAIPLMMRVWKDIHMGRGDLDYFSRFRDAVETTFAKSA